MAIHAKLRIASKSALICGLIGMTIGVSWFGWWALVPCIICNFRLEPKK